jgi:hypothetical protein
MTTMPLAVTSRKLNASQIAAIPSAGCVGSIQWGIDTGRAFDVKGLWRYGRETTNADSHKHALEMILAWDCLWDDEAFTFIAPKTLSVYRVGPRYSYMRSDEQMFDIRQGVAIPRGR